MAAGTADGRCSFYSNGSAHGHTENIPLGRAVDIQVTNIHGRGVLFIRIGHTCGGGILDAALLRSSG